MGKRRVIDVLAERHDEWLKMARSFSGISRDGADEIVQGMYLKMHEYVKDIDRIMYKDTGEVNTFYVWTTMRNLFFSGYHINGNKGKFNAKKTVFVSDLFEGSERTELDLFDSFDIEDESNVEEEGVFEELFGDLKERIGAELDEWKKTRSGWFDSTLYKLHKEKGMSMRKISAKTGISLKAVFLSLKSSKLKLREILKEDYDKYKQFKQSL